MLLRQKQSANQSTVFWRIHQSQGSIRSCCWPGTEEWGTGHVWVQWSVQGQVLLTHIGDMWKHSKSNNILNTTTISVTRQHSVTACENWDVVNEFWHNSDLPHESCFNIEPKIFYLPWQKYFTLRDSKFGSSWYCQSNTCICYTWLTMGNYMKMKMKMMMMMM